MEYLTGAIFSGFIAVFFIFFVLEALSGCWEVIQLLEIFLTPLAISGYILAEFRMHPFVRFWLKI